MAGQIAGQLKFGDFLHVRPFARPFFGHFRTPPKNGCRPFRQPFFGHFWFWAGSHSVAGRPSRKDSERKRHINSFCHPSTPVCAWDKLGLSLGQTGVVPRPTGPKSLCSCAFSGLNKHFKRNQESPRQTKPKKGTTRKVHEFRPFLCEFWCVFLGKQARFTSRTFVPECPCGKFMNWPFFGLSLVWFAGATPGGTLLQTTPFSGPKSVHYKLNHGASVSRSGSDDQLSNIAPANGFMRYGQSSYYTSSCLVYSKGTQDPTRERTGTNLSCLRSSTRLYR